MGLRNLAAFTSNGASLSPTARALGAFMALHSMDPGTASGDPAMVGLYGRGWQYATQMIWPEKSRSAARRAFMRGVRELQDQGLLTALGHAHRGQRQGYQVKM